MKKRTCFLTEVIVKAGLKMVPGGGSDYSPVLKALKLLKIKEAKNAKDSRYEDIWYVLGTQCFSRSRFNQSLVHEHRCFVASIANMKVIRNVALIFL